MPADSLTFLIPLAIFAWISLGAIGWVMFVTKLSARPARAVGAGLFSIPHAIIFGPFFLFIALTVESTQICPYCRSEIPAGATVCQKCTRELPKQ